MALFGIGFSCIPDKVFRDFHKCRQISSYIPLFDPWDEYKTNNNTCCQYICCIGGHVKLTSHTTSTFNMADVNVKQHDSFMATLTLKSNAGDRKVCKKKNLKSWLFGADRKNRPSGSLFGITLQSLVMPNSDPGTDFSIHASHSCLIIFSYFVAFLMQITNKRLKHVTAITFGQWPKINRFI